MIEQQQAFQLVDWRAVPSTEHPGERGWARWHSVAISSSRLRIVEYSAGYVADHWCTRGHFILVLAGELVAEQGGQQITLTADRWYQVADGGSGHRFSSEHGARMFVVD